MNQRRRSTLGRRHLLGLPSSRPSQAQVACNEATAAASGSGPCSRPTVTTNWRGQRSGKKKTPVRFDLASKELTYKKRLFKKSPQADYHGLSSIKDQERFHYSSMAESNLNLTGFESLTETPCSDGKLHQTSDEAHCLRAKSQMFYHRPNVPSSTARSTCAGKDILQEVLTTSLNPDYQKNRIEPSSYYNFDSWEPPKSPGPSLYNRLILEEKLEPPEDPDDNVDKLQGLVLNDSKSLSSPLPFNSMDSLSSSRGKTPTSGVKESIENSSRKLSIIEEDLNTSIMEFEENERTICSLDESGLNNSVRLNTTVKAALSNNSILERIIEKKVIQTEEEDFNKALENVLQRVEIMEQSLTERTKEHLKSIKVLEKKVVNFVKTAEEIKQDVRNVEKTVTVMFKEDMKNISALKELLKDRKSKGSNVIKSENKENISMCVKKQLLAESNWINNLKSENPCLLKTPKPSKQSSNHDLSAVWTPHSLSNVLEHQVKNLFK